MEDKRFLTASDVAEYMGISVPMAYKIIRRLNDELVAAGYIIVSGRISRSYFACSVFREKAYAGNHHKGCYALAKCDACLSRSKGRNTLL